MEPNNLTEPPPESKVQPISIPESAAQVRLLSTAVLRTQLLRLAQKGLNATEAAKLVGCAAATARLVYTEPSFRRDCLERIEKAFSDVDLAYAEKRRNLHEMLEEQAYKSFDDLVGLLEDASLHPALRMKINQDFLNRVEETATTQKQVTNFTPRDLQQAAKVAREMDNVIEMKKVG